MKNALLRPLARLLSCPRVADWFIARAQRTPYLHIIGPDGSLYMGRWWLFNPYPANSSDKPDVRALWRRLLPSVRIHHIIRPDSDRHLHDHPWNARTFVLRGWYEEERPVAMDTWAHDATGIRRGPDGKLRDLFTRRAGYTGRLLFGQYHRISAISEGGVWTLFVTWRKRGSWGFEVDGKKVAWREYLEERGL